MKILLFDIDGTLLSAGGAGTRSLNKAFESVLGINEAFKNFEMAGKTDVQIVKEGLRLYGIEPTSALVNEILSNYIKFLQIEIQNNSKHLKPGVKEFIDLNLTIFGYPMGLLTGNIERGARIKLDPFGLNPLFPFGAFGSDHEDRNQLLPLAIKRFVENFKKDVDFSQVIVIGDTPRDVACAKPYGAKVIAVATGPYSVSELMKTEADIVLENLSEIDKVLPILN